VPGFDELMKQQEQFMKTLLSGMPSVPGWGSSGPAREDEAGEGGSAEDLAKIKKQLAELQKKLS
jgi:hypothetical protein